MHAQESRLWVAVLLALCVTAWAFQGSRGLWEPDEGRYTNVALNMLASGDYLDPMLDHEHPHYTKPPLTYWALALSFRLFGHNAWAARVPGTLAFIFTGLLIGVLSRRFCPRAPWLPVLIWATMLGSVAASNVVSTDMILTLWETLGMAALVAALGADPQRRQRWVLLMWLGWSLAMLTKGPPGLLPFVAALAVLVVRRDGAALKALFPLRGVALFAVLGCGWYFWLALSKPGLAGYFVGYEFYDRIFSGVQDRHPQWYGAFEVYLPILVAGFLPWSAIALWKRWGSPEEKEGVMTVTHSFRRGLSETVDNCHDPQEKIQEKNQEKMLLAAWIGLPLLVFFVAKSRMPLYLLPLHVPLAIVLGRVLAPRFLARPRRFGSFAIVWLLALVAIKGVAPQWTPQKRDAQRMAAELSAQFDLGAIDEIVFVQSKPVYGLRLYLDKQIERIDLQPPAPGKGLERWETMCEELGHDERRIFIVPQSRLQQMHAATRACAPVYSVMLGRVQDYEVLSIDTAVSRVATISRSTGTRAH